MLWGCETYSLGLLEEASGSKGCYEQEVSKTVQHRSCIRYRREEDGGKGSVFDREDLQEAKQELFGGATDHDLPTF